MNVPVSMVVPVHNGRELLEKLLSSIARQSVAPREVIVVDNGSTDGAPDAARNAGAKVLSMGRNLGFAAAVNRGIRDAKGEGIALLNSDVELDSRWLEILWDAITRGGAHFGAGAILQADTQDILDGSFDLVCRGGTAWRAGSGYPAATLSQPEPVRFCPATACIYRSDLFRAIGLFEESFESYLEDVDFGLRCAAAGLRGGYYPAAICWHRGSATFGRWNPRIVRLMSRNQVFLIARHYPSHLIFRWIWPILIAQILWAGLALRHACALAWLRGKIEGLLRFGSVRRSAKLTAFAPEPLARTILESEQRIRDLQSAHGFDSYWKLYFRLAGSSK